MAPRGHFLLNNKSISKGNFVPTRPLIIEEDENDNKTKPASNYIAQKKRLLVSLQTFSEKKIEKDKKRTLNIPEHIDYVSVDFYIIFKNDEFKTKDTFRLKFGLSPVLWKNFNQTVVFAITDLANFQKNFISLLTKFVESSDTEHPSSKDYSILTLISDFEFISYDYITSEMNDYVSDTIIRLVNPSKDILLQFDAIQESFDLFLTNLGKNNENYSYRYIDEKIIEVKNINRDDFQLIINNFDIIHKVSAGRMKVAKPNSFSLDVAEDVTWDIEIENDINAPLVGIIDTGVRKIRPLENIIVDSLGIDNSGNVVEDATNDRQGHGTLVASLVAMGIDFFDTSKKHYITNARIVPIKIQNSATGLINIVDIESAIRKANNNGVSIFNLSMNTRTKNYNDEYSIYAYLLDKLAYELNILIFISAGNLEFEDAKWMQEEILNRTATGDDYSLLVYPNHFYNPYKELDMYSCSLMNIQEPGESLNNVTVGAIAENFTNYNEHLAITKDSPAFYTRKFHFDYSKKVNGARILRSQINYNVFKPDIVMPGGDYIEDEAGMTVIWINDFYKYTAGTSLSAPLAANIAAKIIKLYPTLSLQSVKAIIINSASSSNNYLIFNQLIDEIKIEDAAKRFPSKPISSLTRGERNLLSQLFDSKKLSKYILGNGKPNEETCLYSSDTSVTAVMQESIRINSYKAIKINFPKEMIESERRSFIVKAKATICYSFPPVLNNHLAYNPLHISFTLYKTVSEDDDLNFEILSGQKDHTFYNYSSISSNLTPKAQATLKENIKAGKIAIKTKVHPWSEDFFPYKSKPFSNVQKLEININKEELLKVDGNITVLVRATAKLEDIDAYTEYILRERNHPFSIAIVFEDHSRLKDFDFYDRMASINNLESILRADSDLTLEDDSAILEL